MNNSETIDVESSIVLDLSSKYQGVNADLASMAAGCVKPNIPSCVDIDGDINDLMGTVQKSEEAIGNKMKEIHNVLCRAVETLKANDDVNLLDFFNLDEDFNYAVNDTYDDRELTDDEKQSLLMSLCLSSGIINNQFRDLIIANKDLSDADKDYILSQFDKGNVRAAIGHILVIQAEQDLAAVKFKNEAEIDDLNMQLADLYDERTGLASIYGTESEKLKTFNEQIDAKLKRIKELKNEITNKRLIVYQYKNSEKEWEYDYLLNKVGSSDFENVVSSNKDRDFYRDALKHYYGENHSFTDKDNDTFDYDNFYQVTLIWLSSKDNGLSEEEKNQYLQKLKNMQPTGSIFNEDLYAFNMAARDLAESSDFNNKRFNDLYDSNTFNTNESDIRLVNATKYFDEGHLKVYEYLYNKGDYVAANEYLNTFSDYFNQCQAQEDANTIVKRIISGENVSNILGDVTSYFEGTGIGMQGWLDNVANIISSDGKMTKSEYTQMYVNNMLGGIGLLAPVSYSKDLGITSVEYDKLKKKYGDNVSYLDILHESNQISDIDYNGLQKLKDDKNISNFINNANTTSTFGKTRSEWLETFFGSGVSTGNMLPSVAASFLSSGALSSFGVASVATASKIIGLSTMALGCVSSSKNEALRNGRSALEAWTYGILSGLSETATEYLIGGIPGLSRLDNLAKLIPTSNKFELLGKVLLNTLVVNPAQEITEELAQALIFDPLVETIAFGDKTSTASVNELLEIALQTYFSTLGLGSFGMVADGVNTVQTSNATVGVYTLDDGTNVDVTYGMLMDCIDKETGKISQDKLSSLITDKVNLREISLSIPEFLKNIGKNGAVGSIALADGLDFEELNFGDNINLDDDSIYELSGFNTKNAFLSKILGFKDSVKSFANNFFKKNTNTMLSADLVNPNVDVINDINKKIKKMGEATITINNTSQLSLATLNGVTDLSKLKVRILGGFDDGTGNLKTKYQSDKYADRITLTGYEAQAAIAKINELASQINQNQTTVAKAKEILSLISKEFKYDYELEKYKKSAVYSAMHNIDAGLKGITNVNELNRQGIVCAGFAQLFYELCQRCGIKCDYVRGIALNTDINGKILRNADGSLDTERHAWNVFYTDEGTAVPVDVTWASGEKNVDTWFGKSTDFYRLHIADASENSIDYGQNVTSDIQVALDLLEKNNNNNNSPGVSPIQLLKQYSKDGNTKLFTRTDGIRNIISAISMNEIKSFIKKYESGQLINNNANQERGFDVNWLNTTMASSNNVGLLSKIGDIRSYMNRNGLMTIEDFMKSTKLQQVPPALFDLKKIYATQKVYYDLNNNIFKIKPLFNNRRVEIEVSKDYLNDPTNNASKRIQKIKFTDGNEYYVDSLTGTKVENIDFSPKTRGYNHVFYGEKAKTSSGLSSSGGHLLSSLMASRGKDKVKITVPENGPEKYIISAGNLEIRITYIDPVTKLMEGTWGEISSGATAHHATFWPADIDAKNNTVNDISGFSMTDISREIETLGDSTPIAIQYKENLSGLTTINVAYIGNYNGITYGIIREASGEVITSYPLSGGKSLNLNSSSGWISLVP